MSMTAWHRVGQSRRADAGQSLVLFTLALVALLAMTSLILDGGNAFAQQRIVQNGSDAAAEAGAVVLVQNLIAAGNGGSIPKSDQDVLAAVNAAAANNSISPAPTAYYTDINGDRLAPEVAVGSLGAGSAPPSSAYGVEADGSKTFPTFVGSVFALLPGGTAITQGTASARATAIAGQVQGVCSSDAPCGFLPVTFPTTLTLCDGTGKQINFGEGAPYTPGIAGDPMSEVILPLCKSGDGTVGWLDITPHDPTCNGNGAAFLACEISNPGNTGLSIPIWIHTVPGNTNSVQVQTAMNSVHRQDRSDSLLRMHERRHWAGWPCALLPRLDDRSRHARGPTRIKRQEHLLPDRRGRKLRARPSVHPGEQSRMRRAPWWPNHSRPIGQRLDRLPQGLVRRGTQLWQHHRPPERRDPLGRLRHTADPVDRANHHPQPVDRHANLVGVNSSKRQRIPVS